MDAAAQSRTPPSAEVIRMRRLIDSVVAFIGAFVILDVLLWWYTRDVGSLLVGAITSAMGVGLLSSRRWLLQGRAVLATSMLAASVLTAAFAIVAVRPFLYPVLAMASLMVLVVALPVLHGRSLAGVTAAAWLDSAAIIATGIVLSLRYDPPFSAVVAHAVLGSALAIALGIVLTVFWQFSSQLTGVLHESRRARSDLATANVQMRQLDVLKSRFMNNAAHELNTPLTPVRLQLHLIRNSPAVKAAPEVDEAIRIIDRNVERISRLVAEVLDASRVQGAAMTVHASSMDLAHVLQDTYETYHAPARMAGVQLEMEHPPMIAMSGDARRLTQVFFNLVGNALKFTPRGGRIRILAHKGEDEVAVTVEDDGMGIDSKEIDRLFRPFSQLSTTAPVHGTGLGLYISKGIVAAHGGRIEAQSRGPDQGSRFTVRLPVRPPVDASAGPPKGPRRPRDPDGERIRQLI